MKKAFFLFFLRLLALSLFSATFVAGAQAIKPRVIVMTDGEIDDRSSMIRFLLYTNDVELLAIIETNSVYQRSGHSVDGWLQKQIDAYEKVYPNLIVHDPAYPAPDYVRSVCFVGDENPDHLVADRQSRNRRPGSEVEADPANWPDTPGSDRIVEILLDSDPRPVYIQAWGGGNTAARAFFKLKSEFPDDYERSVSKAIMYNIWYQDGAGNYIEKNHPLVTMLLCHHFDGTWNYNSQHYTYCLIENHVINNHGPLGELYPQHYISEGDTPAFLWAIKNGLRSYEHPTYGGWGGRFYKVAGFDKVYADVSRGSYWKWIEAANRDFEARMDWCVAGKFEEANHKPVVNVVGELDRTVKSGDLVELDAETYDPDGDRISLRWWHYQEAGTYNKVIDLNNPFSRRAGFFAPNVDQPQTIHMIFEARDRGTPALTSYQRVIITVRPANEVLRWRQAMTQNKEWYSSKEAIRIADNVLFFQHENGGWSKNIEWAANFSRDEIADALQYSESVGTTIDNGATHTQMTYLAKVYEGTGRDNYRDAFLRGLDFLLEAQYKIGGWPQYYPLREGYYSHITFNDGAMIEVMRFLRDVAKGDSAYAFVDSVRRKKVEKAVKKGLKIILKTQLKDSDGSLSGWCAQYDKKSLKPAKARSYELPSICGSETGRIVDFLMGIENPGREVVRAVEGAMAWLDRVTIRGIRLERKDDPSLHKGFDLIVVNDPAASPLWARFYEIGTNRPIFIGRDGIVKYSLAEIEQERRVGYRYYVTYPERLLKSTYPEWRKRLIGGQ